MNETTEGITRTTSSLYISATTTASKKINELLLKSKSGEVKAIEAIEKQLDGIQEVFKYKISLYTLNYKGFTKVYTYFPKTVIEIYGLDTVENLKNLINNLEPGPGYFLGDVTWPVEKSRYDKDFIADLFLKFQDGEDISTVSYNPPVKPRSDSLEKALEEENTAEDNSVYNAIAVANIIPNELNKVIKDIAKISNISHLSHSMKMKKIKNCLDNASRQINFGKGLMTVLLNTGTLADKKTLEVVWDTMTDSVLESMDKLKEKPTTRNAANISGTLTKVLVLYKFQLDLFTRHHNWFTRLCKCDENLVKEIFKQSTKKQTFAFLRCLIRFQKNIKRS